MSEQEEKRRLHATHNEDAMDYLLLSRRFPDWVVTTAFYSALHFVKYKAFPLNEDGVEYDNSEDHFIAHQEDGGKKSKHKLLIEVAIRHLRPIGSDYRDLYELCSNARYFNYETSQDDVDLAVDLLARIKAFCNTEKPKKRPRIPKKP